MQEEDFRQADDNVRPRTLGDFIGQNDVRAQLKVFLGAARQLGKALDHTIFYGNPGLGKTTLAQIMAAELGVNIVTITGPMLERPGDLAAILTNLSRNDILFVDEIHRMPITVEEVLYPAMEDFKLDIVVGQGPAASTVKMPLDRFTLVGATTRMGLVSAPLRSRFGIVLHLDFYSPEDLARIVQRSAGILGITVDEEGALEIGRRSRGTPRIANRHLRRVRDYALQEEAPCITKDVADRALTCMNVDREGLDQIDRRILSVIISHYEGGPVGIRTLAVACSEDVRALEEVYEPYLIQQGFIKRTPRGRVATPRAYMHMRNLS
ncbi:MAG: Holliday junction branch migration DNA helicase RuvB [Desulfovibrionaceae bacterium]|nr:Holliday junction branch migration DNA helicase RuvB [Desulfovibrionaceae bacterium]